MKQIVEKDDEREREEKKREMNERKTYIHLLNWVQETAKLIRAAAGGQYRCVVPTWGLLPSENVWFCRAVRDRYPDRERTSSSTTAAICHIHAHVRRAPAAVAHDYDDDRSTTSLASVWWW